MVGEYFLAEAVPFRVVTQVHAVLFPLYCIQEDIMVDTAEEHYMAVTYRSACTAHNGLYLLLLFAVDTLACSCQSR